MNAVVIAVIVMLALSLARVHVVLSLTVGAFAGGLLAGMPLTDVADAAGKVSQPGIITVFQNGLSGGEGACFCKRYDRYSAFSDVSHQWRIPRC